MGVHQISQQLLKGVGVLHQLQHTRSRCSLLEDDGSFLRQDDFYHQLTDKHMKTGEVTSIVKTLLLSWNVIQYSELYLKDRLYGPEFSGLLRMWFEDRFVFWMWRPVTRHQPCFNLWVELCYSDDATWRIKLCNLVFSIFTEIHFFLNILCCFVLTLEYLKPPQVRMILSLVSDRLRPTCPVRLEINSSNATWKNMRVRLRCGCSE